ncbi:hypothetical protein Bhyg_14116, partial [Pseudolycoriella hygida]
MKFAIILLLAIAVGSCCAILPIPSTFRYPSSSCSWFDLNRRQAVIPFCWPNGYPYQFAPITGCYTYDIRAWQDPSVPCLPPVLPCPQSPLGCVVPPCNGRYKKTGKMRKEGINRMS